MVSKVLQHEPISSRRFEGDPTEEYCEVSQVSHQQRMGNLYFGILRAVSGSQEYIFRLIDSGEKVANLVYAGDVAVESAAWYSK